MKLTFLLLALGVSLSAKAQDTNFDSLTRAVNKNNPHYHLDSSGGYFDFVLYHPYDDSVYKAQGNNRTVLVDKIIKGDTAIYIRSIGIKKF